jgi:hypothetical protein
LLENRTECLEHAARVKDAVPKLLRNEGSVCRRRVDDAVQDLAELVDQRGDARGHGRAGAGGRARGASAETGQATAALVKAGAGAASVDLDLDGLPVLFRELALFAARGWAKLQTRVKEEVVTWAV